MAVQADTLEIWRSYFHGANSDIFNVIEHAILVAASDCPNEFKHRRDRIAEILFSCRLTRCLGCDRVEVAVGEEDDATIKAESGATAEHNTPGSAAKESKMASSIDDHGEFNQISNYSYNEAEALTDELEEKDLTVGEVFRIKDILSNPDDQSEGTLFESLRRLQLMELSVGTLKITEVGKVVSALKKNGSKQIRQLAKTLIIEWKNMVDEWVKATAAIAGNSGASSDSMNPASSDDGGLPSPPLDEGAFLATHTTSLEFSQFFDEMDDMGNIKSSEESVVICDEQVKLTPESNPHGRKPTTSPDAVAPPAYFHKQEPVKHTNPVVSNSLSKAQKLTPDNKLNASNATRQQKRSIVDKDSRPLPNSIHGKSNIGDEEAELKFEAAKKRLHEGYLQAENAKRQRTIQVMELRDLPKQGPVQRTVQRHVTQSRHFSHGRR